MAEKRGLKLYSKTPPPYKIDNLFLYYLYLHPIAAIMRHNNTSTHTLKWNTHAMERKQEREIALDPATVSIDYISTLPYYTNNECYHYCDTKQNVTYYVRDIPNEKGNMVKTVVTIIKRNPIQMARRICEINGWKFESICRDNLFGNCMRGSGCRYIHKDI